MVEMITEKEFLPVLPTLSLCKGPKMQCTYLHTVPRTLMREQCDNWASFSGEFIHAGDNGVYFLQMTIAGDKTRCFLYTLKSKQ